MKTGIRPRWLTRQVRRFAFGRDGNISPLMALMLIPVVGMLGVATEASNWFFTARSAQHAADSAVLAAGTRALVGDSNYQSEGVAVAGNYGFPVDQNNVAKNNVTVDIESGVTCPNNPSDTGCYQATITKLLPIYLTRIAGFKGDSGSLKQVQALAIAEKTTIQSPDCILSTSTNSQAVRTNGGNLIDLNGCSVATNGGADCNGHTWEADIVYVLSANANSSKDHCGNQYVLGTSSITDPYASLESFIPADNCGGSYPQAVASGAGKGTVPTSNQWSGTKTWDGATVLCGDQQVTGATTISNNPTIVIYNGRLDLNGQALTTASGASATIIFAGNNTCNCQHTLIGSGTLNLNAPTSGTWSGMLMYQDPSLTDGQVGSGSTKAPALDLTFGGSSPTMKVTGAVYVPNANVTIAGAINHFTYACFTLVDYTTLLSGTGAIFQDSLGNIYNSQGQCTQAGVTQVTTPTYRMALVR